MSDLLERFARSKIGFPLVIIIGVIIMFVFMLVEIGLLLTVTVYTVVVGGLMFGWTKNGRRILKYLFLMTVADDGVAVPKPVARWLKQHGLREGWEEKAKEESPSE